MPPEVQRHCGLTVGTWPDADIPMPVVDLAEATRQAKAALHARRSEPEVQAGKKAIVDKHASRRLSDSLQRKRQGTRRKSTAAAPPNSQLGFDF
jgi:deoxyribodipyrimidine photo-lyase